MQRGALGWFGQDMRIYISPLSAGWQTCRLNACCGPNTTNGHSYGKIAENCQETNEVLQGTSSSSFRSHVSTVAVMQPAFSDALNDGKAPIYRRYHYHRCHWFSTHFTGGTIGPLSCLILAIYA
jgi:hypothetical protein